METPRRYGEPAARESEIISVLHLKSDEDLGEKHGSMKRAVSTASSEHSHDSWKGGKQNSVFVDAEAMKAKLRKSLTKPEYDVTDFYHKDGWCQLVARSSWFEKITLSVIAFNALWIAIDTDMNGAPVLLAAHPVFQVAEHGFCVYFFWEWTMRFFAFRRKRDGLRDAWFVFDSVLVFMMVAETWVMTMVLLALGGASAGGLGGNTGTLRLLRLLRLSRMARMAKLLRSFPELLILIKGMASATRSVFVTLLLLFLLIYVYSIMFRQLTDGSDVGLRYFPDMWVAIHTLWIDGTLLDSPGTLATRLLEESIAFVILFYSFVLLAALTVMNMLIGVLCEVVSAVASTEREQIMMSTVKDGFMEIIRQGGIDTNGDNMISRQEFVAILESPDAVKLLIKVDVDPYAFVDLADFLFEEEDGQEERQMTFAEFMETVLSLRGTNNATVKDVVDLRKFIKTQFAAMDSKNEVRQSVVRRSIKEQSRRENICQDSMGLSNVELESNHLVEVPPVVPPVAYIPSPGLTHSCSTASCTAGQSQLWMQVAQMQGVLSAAQKRLEQFVHTIPSPPSTASSIGICCASALSIGDACQMKAPGSSPPCGLRRTGSGGSASLMTLRHQRSGSSLTTTAATGAASASAATPAPADVPLSGLPGMVRGALIACQQAIECSHSEASVVEIGEVTQRSRSVTKASPGPEEPTSLSSRLAELRVHFQQLGQSLELGVEELRAIQEML